MIDYEDRIEKLERAIAAISRSKMSAPVVAIFLIPPGGIAGRDVEGVMSSGECIRYSVERVNGVAKIVPLSVGGGQVIEILHNDMTVALEGGHLVKALRCGGVWLPFTEDCG